MKNDDFERLLDLYLKGRLPASKKAELEKQLDEFKKTDGIPYEFNEQHASDLWRKISAGTEVPKSPRWSFMPIAAVLAIAGIAALLTLVWNRASDQHAGKKILADGTLVWLKEDASLVTEYFSASNREVTLKGEALFEVAKDREHPFIINCGRYTASVLGTSFNIKASDSTVELTVLTGRVRLTSVGSDSSVIVSSREHVIFSESRVVTRSESSPEEVQVVMANTEYDMHFEDTRMSEIVGRVEGKFNVSVSAENDDLLNCMISADFTDQSLPVTLAMISEALGIEYEIDGRNVTIRGTGCKE